MQATTAANAGFGFEISLDAHGLNPIVRVISPS
jgi:hypothetical protein